MFPVGRESRFEAIFMFPVGRESRFEAIFMFPVGRESCFEDVFLLPRGWKCDFQRFFNFGRGRNAVFFIFKLSAAAEMQFSPFFVFRPRPKRFFCCFLLVRRGGKSIFSVFSLSSMDDE